MFGSNAAVNGFHSAPAFSMWRDETCRLNITLRRQRTRCVWMVTLCTWHLVYLYLVLDKSYRQYTLRDSFGYWDCVGVAAGARSQWRADRLDCCGTSDLGLPRKGMFAPLACTIARGHNLLQNSCSTIPFVTFPRTELLYIVLEALLVTRLS
jgi:hypothetical protein